MFEPNAVAGPSTSRRSLSPSGPSNPQHPSKRQRTQNAIEDSLAPPSAMRKPKGRKKRATSSDPVPLATTPTSRFPAQSQNDVFDSTPSRQKDHSSPAKESQADGTIRCICETHWDDGQMVQCDVCQTWQHTKCYKVDFERLTRDSAAVWICLVCGPEKWTEMTLEPEWAKRMQKKEEERERMAALTKQLDLQAQKNGTGRKGRGGRKPGNSGAAGTIGPSSALAGSGVGPGNTEKEEELDEVDSWRQVYVPLKQNVIESEVRPQIRHFLSTYGPGSKFFAKALEANRGWTTPSSKGKERDVTGYDVLGRSLPIVVTADELTAAENEEWVNVRSMHVPPIEDTSTIPPPSLRSVSPSAPRIRDAGAGPGYTQLLAPPVLSVDTAQSDYSYGNVFRRTVALNASAGDPESPVKGLPLQRNLIKPPQNPSPAAPERGRSAVSPTAGRSRRITPVDDEITEPRPIAGSNGIPKSNPFTAQRYSLHATQVTPPRTLLAIYPANVSSHSAYLATPSNQYFHLGAPKSHVQIFGAPLEVALDARIVGGIGRFVRCGCWPNAVLRTVVVKPDKRKRAKKSQRFDDNAFMDGDDDDDIGTSLHFGIFALRELAEGEEVVIAWEWDDAHRIHRLPKLLLEEARMLLDRESASFSEYECKYFDGLCQTLLEAFTSCACAENPQVRTSSNPMPNGRPSTLSATEPTKTCAIEELSRWVTRRKGELDPKSAESTAAHEDDDRTEPDEDLGRQSWTPHRPGSSQANPPLLIHPSAKGGITSHTSVSHYTQPVHPSLGSTFLHPSLQRNQAQKPPSFHSSLLNPAGDRGSPGPSSSFHPTNYPHPPLMAPKPVLASDDPRFGPSRPSSSSALAFRPSAGPGSLASLIHPTDTSPLSGQLSRPTSSSSHIAIQPRNEVVPVSRAVTTTPTNRLRQVWGRNVTAASLTVRDNEDDEDVLIRALGISLGPVIGSKRGVRIEDASGGGLLGVKVVQGYGKVTSGDVRLNGKRKRTTEDHNEDHPVTGPVEKRRKVVPALPPGARRKRVHAGNPKRIRQPSGQMEIDRAESPFDYPFTFSVPPLPDSVQPTSSSPAASDMRTEDVEMHIETTAAEIRPYPGHPLSSSMDRSHSFSASPQPSKRSAMMSIANMLNSPPAPTFSRESFQRKMSRQEPRSESHSPAPPSPPLPSFPPQSSAISRTASPLSAQEVQFIPEASPSVEASSRYTSRDSAATNDTAVPIQQSEALEPSVSPNSTIPELPTEEAPVSLPEHTRSPQVDETNMDIPESQQHTPEVNNTSLLEEERARPITPVPMVIPPQSMDRRWQSPAASSSHEEQTAHESHQMVETENIRKESPLLSDRSKVDKVARTSSPVAMAPIVVRGRLMTPPSRGSTPTPAPPSLAARRTRSVSTSETSTSDEENDDSEEDDEDSDSDEDSDVKMESDTDDSDSLTPAPSPPALPAGNTSTQPAQDRVESSPPLQAQITTPEPKEQQDPSPAVHQAEPCNVPNDSAFPGVPASGPLSSSPSASPEHPVNETLPSSLNIPDVPQVHVESEEPATPAVPVRRMTLKDYARRKKKDVVSPSNLGTVVAIAPVTEWTSPSAGRSVPLPEAQLVEAPSKPQEEPPSITDTQASSQIERKPTMSPSEPLPSSPAKLDIPLNPPVLVPIIQRMENYITPDQIMPEPNGHAMATLVTSSPVPPSSVHNAVHVVNADDSNLEAPKPPPNEAPVIAQTPLSLAERITSMGDPKYTPPRSRTPLPKSVPNAMEDGEIDASQPSSPARLPTRSNAVSPSASFQATARNGSPRHGDDRDRELSMPTHPKSFTGRTMDPPSILDRDRSPMASSSTSTNAPGGTSTSTTPKTNGAPATSTPRPPIGPRSNAPPPSGPRALRGLDPRSHQSGGWDKASRPWDRYSDRVRDRDRDDRDRDRDRDRGREDRYWRDGRSRGGGYRPRGK